VLLVHGYACNRGVFRTIRARLAAEGYAAYVHDLDPMYANIDTYIPALAARIDAILARTGRSRLAVVCHSMGGLALRAYLRDHGGAMIAVLVTIGTPHHGTRHAALGAGINSRQMAPGSAWLQALGPRGDHPPVAAIWSTHDNIVAPQESAALEGAENLPLSGIGHLSLLHARPSVDRIVEVLRRRMPL
jgi:triacylglycerol lipase